MISNTTCGRIFQGIGVVALVKSVSYLNDANNLMFYHLAVVPAQISLIKFVALAALGIVFIGTGSRNTASPRVNNNDLR